MASSRPSGDSFPVAAVCHRSGCPSRMRNRRHLLPRPRRRRAARAAAARSIAWAMGAADPSASGGLLHHNPSRPLLGSVANLEERGRSGYMAFVRGLLNALAIMPGESVLEVGCGSGVIMRELARRTGGANRLIGREHQPVSAARREGLLDWIDFGRRPGRSPAAARRRRRYCAFLDRVRRGRR
jgi:hypothetical protein